MAPSVQLLVSSPKGTLVIHCRLDESAESLRRRLSSSTGLPAGKQLLIYGGKPVEGGRRLSELGIGPLSTLSFTPLLLGGADAIAPVNGFYFGGVPENLVVQGLVFDFREIDDVAAKRKFMRGGKVYIRPSGYARLALNVVGKYGDDAWLGPLQGKRPKGEVDDYPGEWAVAYHGTDLTSALNIVRNGFKRDQSKRNVWGDGIYTTPDPYIAEGYADQRPTWTHEGKVYKILVQMRVKQSSIYKENGAKYWLVKDEASIRPYGLCVKEVVPE